MAEDTTETVVEIGPRGVPALRELRQDLISPGSTAVYVEKRKHTAQKASEVVQRIAQVSEKNIVLQGNGAELPLPDNSVGAILAQNLFGAHGHLYMTEKGRLSREEEQLPPIAVFAKEWSRVCKPSKGRVIIIETSTPANKKEMEKSFTEAGFRLAEEHKGRDIFKLSNLYEPGLPLPSHSTYPPGSYALVFKKS